MDTIVPTSSAAHSISTAHPAHPSVIDETIDRHQQMIQAYWDENPDLYRAVQLKKKQKAHEESVATTAAEITVPRNKENRPEAPLWVSRHKRRIWSPLERKC